MSRTASNLVPEDRAFLLHLQASACRYFVDNQTPDGLFLDRQANLGPRRITGWRSTAAGGMGLIALALASAAPLRMLSRDQARSRVKRAVTTALGQLPHTHGIVPHFLEPCRAVAGADVCSTIDSAWLLAGALWAAAFLGDAELEEIGRRLFERVDWSYWTVPPKRPMSGLIRHGTDRAGRFLPCAWDRLNGETVFMYVLAAGAARGRRWPAGSWSELQPFYGSAGGLSFVSADLGLFVFQYGLDLLDLERWQEPGGLDLPGQAALATEANFRCCRAAADRFKTYRHHWGLSAGDGPGELPAADTYRCYAPARPLDGTAHLTATLASIAHRPELVLDNLDRARRRARPSPMGRYGFSNINLDRRWVSNDMVGIDAGAAVLALDNFLADNRVRNVFHELPQVAAGLEHIGFVRRIPGTVKTPPRLSRAS
jgi:hypothetical protein